MKNVGKTVALGILVVLVMANFLTLQSGSYETSKTTNSACTGSDVAPLGNTWATRAPMPTARLGLAAATVGDTIYALGGVGTSYYNITEAYNATTNVWQTKAPMPTIRSYPDAVTVDGKIYVIGGWDSSNYFPTVERYDSVSNSWATMAPMKSARFGLGVAETNGIIYAVGGKDATGVLKTVEAYSPVNNTWWYVKSLPTPTQYPGVVSVNGIVYSIGGFTNSGTYTAAVYAYSPGSNFWYTVASLPFARTAEVAQTNGMIYAIGNRNSAGNDLHTVHQYNVSTDSWWQVADMPTARSSLGVAIANNKLYAIGGNTPSYTYNINEEYTPPGPDSWIGRRPMLTARLGLCAATVGDTIYAIGGVCTSYYNINEAYNATTNTWQTKAPMPTIRSYPDAVTVDGKIYVIGGWDSSNYFPTVERYDPVSNSWATMAPMNSARFGLGVAEINGIIYAVGGKDATGVLRTVEAYSPVNNTWWYVKSLPTPTQYPGVVSVNGIVYSIGGFTDSGTYSSAVYAYSPGSNFWYTVASLPFARTTEVAQMNGLIYAVGDRNTAGNDLNIVHVYNVSSDTWSRAADMPTARSSLGVAVANSRLYAIGGNTPVITYDVNEEYTPVVYSSPNNPPVCSIYSPVNYQVINGTVDIVGTASDPDGDSGLVAIELKIDSGNWFTVTGTKNWTYQWDTKAYSNGYHEIIARSKDNKSAYSSVDLVAVNIQNINHPPLCSITTPNSGDIVNGSVTICGTASDPDGNATLVKVEINIDNSSWMNAAGTSSWAFQWDTTVVSDGSYAIYARARDTGSLLSQVASIVVNVKNVAGNSPPTCDITSPLQGDTIHGVNFINGTASDPDGSSGVVRVEVKIDSGSWIAASGTTSWSYEWNTSTVANGNHVIYARSLDNKSAYSQLDSVIVNVDNTVLVNHKSSCTITVPSQGEIVSGSAVTILGTASDPDGNSSLDKVQVKIDSGGSWVAAMGTTGWQYTWNSLGKNGSHTIYARALDINSTYSDEANITVIVDNGAKLGWLDGTVCSGNMSAIPGATVSVNQTGNSAITDVSGKYNITIEAGGPYDLRATAYNHQTGYQTGKYVTWKNATAVDFVLKYTGPHKPVCRITSPSQDDTVLGTMTIHGTASDVLGDSTLVKVEVRIDTGGWTLATGKALWNYSWVTTTVLNGTHSIYVRAMDDESTYSVTDSIDVNVQNPPYVPPSVKRIEIAIQKTTMGIAETQTLKATGFDKDNNQVSGIQFTWKSTSGGIATSIANDLAIFMASDVNVLHDVTCIVFANYSGVSANAIITLSFDNDKDGMPDGWELHFGLNPNMTGDANADPDGDGLTSVQEYNYSYNRFATDVGLYGLAYLYRVENKHYNSLNPRDGDTDADQLGDGVEILVHKTDPLFWDSNNDGSGDSVGRDYKADVEILPDGWMKVKLYWSTYEIEVMTNSSVLGVTFDKDKKVLTVMVSGANGTSGACIITVPKALIESSSNISAYLDDQPLSFVLTQNSTHYTIKMEYKHSQHKLTTNLATSPAKSGETAPFLWLYVSGVIICMGFAIAMLVFSHHRSLKRHIRGKKRDK